MATLIQPVYRSFILFIIVCGFGRKLVNANDCQRLGVLNAGNDDFKPTACKNIAGGTVFHLDTGKTYDMATSEIAATYCANVGAQLASHEQLKEAWENGYDTCACGWLTSGTSMFPRREKEREGCLTPMAVHVCSWTSPGWDAYCFKSDYGFTKSQHIKNGLVFHLTTGKPNDMASSEIAATFCASAGAQLASPEQLQEAWENGFDTCECGWLTSGTVMFPRREEAREGEGCLTPMAVHVCSWARSGWDAYCFKPDYGFTSSQRIEDGLVFHLTTGKPNDMASQEIAATFCANVGAQLASPEQLKEAWENGYDTCECGWLTSGTVMFPRREKAREGEGCLAPMAVHVCSWARSGWDAYCFKSDYGFLPSQPIRNGFVFRASGGVKYMYTSKDAGASACASIGGQLATYNQLFEAWFRGFDQCSCGWLADSNAKYPIRTYKRTGCGATMTINDCTATEIGQWGGPGWDAYCYKPTGVEFQPTKYKGIAAGIVFHLTTGKPNDMASQEIAATFCANVGAQLASPEQLKEAWENGYDTCECGWLTSGTVMFPRREKAREGEGCLAPMAVHVCSWARSGWDAYCFKPV